MHLTCVGICIQILWWLYGLGHFMMSQNRTVWLLMTDFDSGLPPIIRQPLSKPVTTSHPLQPNVRPSMKNIAKLTIKEIALKVVLWNFTPFRLQGSWDFTGLYISRTETRKYTCTYLSTHVMQYCLNQRYIINVWRLKAPLLVNCPWYNCYQSMTVLSVFQADMTNSLSVLHRFSGPRKKCSFVLSYVLKLILKELNLT